MSNALKELNFKLLVEITVLRKENAVVKAENTKVKAENTKSKQAMEENLNRFMKLERNDKEKTGLIAKLNDDIKEIKQSSVKSAPYETNFDDTPERIENKKEINEFLELWDNERVSNMARERNKEKKICTYQQSMQKISSSSNIQNDISPEMNPTIKIIHDHNTIQLEPRPTDQAQSIISSEIKIPYNKRVERGLSHDLSVFKANNDKINNVFDIQIPEFLLELDKKRFYVGIVTIKYIRIEDIKRVNKIDESARTLVYDEIKTFLQDITDINLQKTFRA
ncbi:5648_t:CDS:2 [Diversispora eburnea]|uniref:5648_t:CDS:1 n=1 Tax=Diversispora eburnea TaxID=1213867 RepID=A0A9N8WT30_9GLOM|nr:5648_t:CDS:2 [Diversispora eburnea]